MDQKIEDSIPYKFAKAEFEVETLHKQIEALKQTVAKLTIYKEKWESIVSLNLKLQEASQTIYSLENIVMTVNSKMNN